MVQIWQESAPTSDGGSVHDAVDACRTDLVGQFTVAASSVQLTLPVNWNRYAVVGLSGLESILIGRRHLGWPGRCAPRLGQE